MDQKEQPDSHQLSMEEALKSCRYYHGEEECPYVDSDIRSKFWFGEKQFCQSGGDIGEWTKLGQEVVEHLQEEKKMYAERYTPQEFGIVLYIETLFSSHDPYDDMRWIFEY